MRLLLLTAVNVHVFDSCKSGYSGSRCEDSRSALSEAAIVGIAVVGGVLLVVLIVAVCCYLATKRRKRSRQMDK